MRPWDSCPPGLYNLAGISQFHVELPSDLKAEENSIENPASLLHGNKELCRGFSSEPCRRYALISVPDTSLI